MGMRSIPSPGEPAHALAGDYYRLPAQASKKNRGIAVRDAHHARTSSSFTIIAEHGLAKANRARNHAKCCGLIVAAFTRSDIAPGVRTRETAPTLRRRGSGTACRRNAPTGLSGCAKSSSACPSTTAGAACSSLSLRSGGSARGSRQSANPISTSNLVSTEYDNYRSAIRSCSCSPTSHVPSEFPLKSSGVQIPRFFRAERISGGNKAFTPLLIFSKYRRSSSIREKRDVMSKIGPTSLPIQRRPFSSAAINVVPAPPNGSKMRSCSFDDISMTRSRSFNESSLPSLRPLYFWWRTGGISNQTSVKFMPEGFILLL
jgi:hypothetical protein